MFSLSQRGGQSALAASKAERLTASSAASNALRSHDATAIILTLLLIAACCFAISVLCMCPQEAYAENAASTGTADSGTSSIYSLYDTKQKNQQITINKIWDDGLTSNDRQLSDKVNGDTDYKDLLAISIMTGVPQSALRIYQIVFDANGGSYGTDSNGNSITTNTLTYNSKNAVTAGTYAVPERTDGYTCIGWSTSSTATSADYTITSAVNNPSLTNQWFNARTDKSTTTLYAVWKDLSIKYAVMAYGAGIDIDKDGNTMGLTFGPALGYPEFSSYNYEGSTGSYDSSNISTMTRYHTTADTSIMDETAAACTDDSHSIITDADDAGTDAAGNRYRCLHYDNWNTIIYWNKKDPHVYDKCIKKGCSKTVIITPTQGTISNGIFSTNSKTFTGDGDSYIINSVWDLKYSSDTSVQDIRKAKHGYGASLIRAKLVGADSHTNAGEYYAGSDALTKYTAISSILSCFPKNLQAAIGYKNLSGNVAANYPYDVASNDGVCDKLWLLSIYEMNSGGKTVYADNSISQDDFYNNHKTRASKQWWWLRSPGRSYRAWFVSYNGSVSGSDVSNGGTVSPGFSLASN